MNILLGSLVVWKITVMFMKYNGPLDLIKYFRLLINNLHRRISKKFLSFDCYFCLSTVVALVLAVFLFSGWDILFLGLSMSAISYVPYMVFSTG